MVKLFHNKKAAAEVFNLVVPIILFMIVCMIMYVLFSLVNYGGRFKRDSFDGLGSEIDNNYLFLQTLLSTRFPYIDENGVKDLNYNISLYEIIYYNMEGRYKDLFKNIVDSLFDNKEFHSTFFSEGNLRRNTNIILVIYSTDRCYGRISLRTTENPLSFVEEFWEDYEEQLSSIKSMLINNRCVALSKMRIIKV
jgi:hypothetical protein